MHRIGYQGDVGSNSEEASLRFIERFGLGVTELVPLVGSRAVVDALHAGIVDLGVVACRNSIAGRVNETHEAVDDGHVECLGELSIPIHHCMFKLPNIAVEDLVSVASHIQALVQTRVTRAAAWSNLVEQPVADTAIAARWLSDGTLPPTTAVLCRRNAGELFGLELIAENLEDSHDNHTDFMLLRC